MLIPRVRIMIGYEDGTGGSGDRFFHIIFHDTAGDIRPVIHFKAGYIIHIILVFYKFQYCRFADLSAEFDILTTAESPGGKELFDSAVELIAEYFYIISRKKPYFKIKLHFFKLGV